MTSDEYCRHRPNEAWFTGVLSLLLLVIMRVRLLGHSALIILIRNQERERLGKKKNRVLVHREKIFFFYSAACGQMRCLNIGCSECILWILFDFVLHLQITEESK